MFPAYSDHSQYSAVCLGSLRTHVGREADVRSSCGSKPEREKRSGWDEYGGYLSDVVSLHLAGGSRGQMESMPGRVARMLTIPTLDIR